MEKKYSITPDNNNSYINKGILSPDINIQIAYEEVIRQVIEEMETIKDVEPSTVRIEKK